MNVLHAHAFHSARLPALAYSPAEVSWVNAGFSTALTVLIVVVLLRYNHQYNIVERLGHGVAGAAAFLSTFKQLGFAALMVPFNDLYQIGWRLAWILVLAGKIWRLERHSRANKKAVRDAKDYLSRRGMA